MTIEKRFRLQTNPERRAIHAAEQDHGREVHATSRSFKREGWAKNQGRQLFQESGYLGWCAIRDGRKSESVRVWLRYP